MKSSCAVNLHNAVTVSQQRQGKRVAQLSSARMNEVCAALRFSLDRWPTQARFWLEWGCSHVTDLVRLTN